MEQNIKNQYEGKLFNLQQQLEKLRDDGRMKDQQIIRLNSDLERREQDYMRQLESKTRNEIGPRESQIYTLKSENELLRRKVNQAEMHGSSV